MDLIPVKTPKMVRALFPNYLWQVSTDEKYIYLTFDDGPTPEVTDFVLDSLEAYNASATFFCIGKNIQDHPELFQRILEADHTIGNHSQNHLKGWRTPLNQYINDVERCQELISQFAENDAESKLFRPPYGKLTPAQGKALLESGYKIVMWDVLSFDWKATVSETDCLKKVIDSTGSGSIIVFHDSLKASKNVRYALPKVLAHFSKLGYQFKSLSAI